MIRIKSIALAALLIVCSASAIMAAFSTAFLNHAAGFSASCSQSSAFLARATNITVTADKTNYDTMICGMVTDGVFSSLDALYILAAPDSTTALLNLVQNSFNATNVGSLSFSAAHGFTGNGTSVLDTGFTPSTGGSQFGLNGASLGAYVLSSNTSENAVAIGSFNLSNATTSIALQPAFSGLTCFLSVNSGAGETVSNSQGFQQCVRTNSTTAGISTNGATLTNSATTANILDNVTLTMFCRHDGTGATYDICTTDQMSAAYIGGTLTNTNVANMSSRINAFMTAYGINVY